MKHIVKRQEPNEFSEWKKLENDDWLPSFTDLRGKEKKAVVSSLLVEQGHICCYCEQSLLENGLSHLEHFQPQAAFPELALEYNNFLYSCGPKVEKNGVRVSATHCGHKRGSSELLISPLNIDCESRFSYAFDGEIRANLSDDNVAVDTILILGLNDDDLKDLRSSAIEPFLDDTLMPDELIDFVKGYLALDSDGKYSPFWTTIDQLAKTLIPN